MRNKRRWKSSLCAGGLLSMVPVLAGLAMFAGSHNGLLTRLAYPFFGLGVPGLLFEALIMSKHEPHGGGTPLEMLLIIMPFNIAFYTVLTYGITTIIMRIIMKSKGRKD